MPKKVSKSVVQKVNQKQTVTINLPATSRRRRSTKVKVVAPINTGTMLSSIVVPSGYNNYPTMAFRGMHAQSHHGLGRTERTMDDIYSNVDRSRFISADPKPIVRPIDQPQAYDYGFVDKSESPMPFLENSIRRTPVKMENIPIPQQGMYTTPIIDDARREMSSIDNQLANRLMDIKESDRKIELRKRIDKAVGGGGGGFSDETINAALNRYNDYTSAGLPPASPYESAESKVEFI